MVRFCRQNSCPDSLEPRRVMIRVDQRSSNHRRAAWQETQYESLRDFQKIGNIAGDPKVPADLRTIHIHSTVSGFYFMYIMYE